MHAHKHLGINFLPSITDPTKRATPFVQAGSCTGTEHGWPPPPAISPAASARVDQGRQRCGWVCKVWRGLEGGKASAGFRHLPVLSFALRGWLSPLFLCDPTVTGQGAPLSFRSLARGMGQDCRLQGFSSAVPGARQGGKWEKEVEGKGNRTRLV